MAGSLGFAAGTAGAVPPSRSWTGESFGRPMGMDGVQVRAVTVESG
jgi:hypothetical protein